VESFSIDSVKMLPPIARPPKLLLLAGNYVEHIMEQGDLAAERAHTFPYVFMKPPSTTLVGSGANFVVPAISPHKIDYELELGVIIGRKGKNIPVDQALSHVAGYTVINDISDRGFKPNPTRQERPRDKFFDWQHGKWHDGSCPMGPCLTTADEISNPQTLSMKLSIDGTIRQNASTSLQVFSVAEVISFISSFLTLEVGDIISTGTPSGVGNATGDYLKPGQRIEASIEKIGTLITTITSDSP
jgi:2-keto-4-pentenoate hydratase/2-oxohepta-3-ene-1,7-dioic acid hydratase in catechol pathway